MDGKESGEKWSCEMEKGSCEEVVKWEEGGKKEERWGSPNCCSQECLNVLSHTRFDRTPLSPSLSSPPFSLRLAPLFPPTSSLSGHIWPLLKPCLVSIPLTIVPLHVQQLHVACITLPFHLLLSQIDGFWHKHVGHRRSVPSMTFSCFIISDSNGHNFISPKCLWRFLFLPFPLLHFAGNSHRTFFPVSKTRGMGFCKHEMFACRNFENVFSKSKQFVSDVDVATARNFPC